MLLRTHRSFKIYSNQGFEASHKIHRALYSRASNHDQEGENQSVDQMITHWLSEMMLSLRIQFYHAKKTIDEGKRYFHYRGCGWEKKIPNWSEDDKIWIKAMNDLFTAIYGQHYLTYTYSPDKGTKVSENCIPQYVYNHSVWEDSFSCVTDKDGNISTPSSNITEQDEETCLTPSQHNNSINTPVIKGVSSPILIEESCTPPMSPCHTPCQQTSQGCLSSTNTRLEFASAAIPPLSTTRLFKKDITKCYGLICESDPFSLKERPAENVVEWADELLRQEKKASAVKIGTLGVFTSSNINMLRKFCEVQKLQRQINEEEAWLTQWRDNLSDGDIDTIRDVLLNTKMSESLFKVGQKSLDILSFTTLVGERYLDNFSIDCFVMKFIEDARLQGNETAVFLPTETLTWLSSADDNFIQDKIFQSINNCTTCYDLILMPVHMNNCHWGLVVIDFVNERLLFDDGLKFRLSTSLLPHIKKILDIIQNLKTKAAPCIPFWSRVTDFERFGMPHQRDFDKTGQGSGSCGVGVILAARDFVLVGPQMAGQFQWHFGEMRRLRKELMLQVIRWMKS